MTVGKLFNMPVNIGGLPEQVLSSGLTPSLVGLYQVNVQVPGGVAPGDSLPVTLSVAGQNSPQALLSIRYGTTVSVRSEAKHNSPGPIESDRWKPTPANCPAQLRRDKRTPRSR